MKNLSDKEQQQFMDKEFNTLNISRQHILDAYNSEGGNDKVEAVLKNMSDEDMRTFLYDYFGECLFKTLYEDLVAEFNNYLNKEK